MESRFGTYPSSKRRIFMITLDCLPLMHIYRIIGFVAVLGAAACTADQVNPPAPAGTVFNGEASGFGGKITDSPPCANCGPTSTAGFQALVERDGQNTTLEAGESNVVAVSTTGFLNLSAQMLDGQSKIYNFTFTFNNSTGQYGIMGSRQWAAGTEVFTKAGLSYSEAVSTTATPQVSSDASGTLTITLASGSRIAGQFTATATMADGEVPLSGSFNVPVQQQ